MGRPGALIGALVSILLTFPLIAIFYLAQQLFGLPFVPFDLFDWLARHLPGAVIALGIDTMVLLIRALHLGEISSAAKRAEQIQAVIGLFILCVVSGTILFAVLWPSNRGPAHRNP